jgi:hypothetical protein
VSGTRDDAHRLVDALDDDQVAQAVQVLRQLADEPEEPLAREFSWIGMLSAEPDLAERSSQIVRREFASLGVGHGPADLGARVKDLVRRDMD